MDDPKISIIIPFYNGIDYLQACVDSVCAQTLREIEILLIDDGSVDGSGALADTLAAADPRITVLHQTNSGPSCARNRGLDAARGEFIGFADGDDLLAPDMYEKLYTTAVRERCDIVVGAYRSFNDSEMDPPTVPIFYGRGVLDKAQIQSCIADCITDKTLPFVWCRLYTRALLQGNHIRFDERLRLCEDATFSMECFLHAARMTAISDTVYYYRWTPDSLMRKKKYNPYISDCLMHQYAIKCALTAQHIPQYTQSICLSLAKHTYHHLAPLAFGNLFRKKGKTYGEFRRLARSALFRDMFRYYDICEKRSRSLDWVMLRLIELHLLLPAFFIGKMIYGKEP